MWANELVYLCTLRIEGECQRFPNRLFLAATPPKENYSAFAVRMCPRGFVSYYTVLARIVHDPVRYARLGGRSLHQKDRSQVYWTTVLALWAYRGSGEPPR